MSRIKTILSGALIAAISSPAFADAIAGGAEKQATNWHAIAMFAVFVLFTLGITYWAAKLTRSAAQFYTAGGGITGFQNGFGLFRGYMSAPLFFGNFPLVF